MAEILTPWLRQNARVQTDVASDLYRGIRSAELKDKARGNPTNVPTIESESSKDSGNGALGVGSKDGEKSAGGFFAKADDKSVGGFFAKDDGKSAGGFFAKDDGKSAGGFFAQRRESFGKIGASAPWPFAASAYGASSPKSSTDVPAQPARWRGLGGSAL